MNKELSDFAVRFLPLLRDTARQARDNDFDELALELFALQFQNNPAYRKICEAGRFTPEIVEHWTRIHAVPTAAFKELELTCLPPNERTTVFHSSGTTEQRPSCHFHNTESLAVYEASLWSWFTRYVVSGLGSGVPDFGLCVLAPPLLQAPHSSLVHMLETVRRKLDVPESAFVGKLAIDGSWALNFDAVLAVLSSRRQPASPKREREGGTPDARPQTPNPKPLLLLGTAFSFVHLLDFLVEKKLRFNLPAGSRVMETGGYKNRSRTMPKEDLHTLIAERLGVPPENIVCEYGMSELSSQAYDSVAGDEWRVTSGNGVSRHASRVTRHFHFPAWARVQIISPETGQEVGDGETGLIRIFDLANVFSVMAIQTEDLGIRRGAGFELIGRAQLAEPRGCSLMSHSAPK